MRNNAGFPVVVAFKSIFSIAEGDRRSRTDQSSNIVNVSPGSSLPIVIPFTCIVLNIAETVAVFDGYGFGFTNDTADAASAVEISEIGAVIEIGVAGHACDSAALVYRAIYIINIGFIPAVFEG